MFVRGTEIRDLDDLRRFVESTLCGENELEVGVFGMTERVLVRSGAPCGMYFCIHGPRSVRLTAIWETEQNSVLFYNSAGERHRRVHLVQTPQMALAAARQRP